eukprot:TRINITY_DN11226_c0_g1_i1.p1 TRINITY_DN11226_c0_g1~~TRINITY_DN11226_c0_g1_i1.p1  ORF type:complete len:335 (-),score=55.65 TRINITY_DN11226_c0_g1_i1:38-1042(-)
MSCIATPVFSNLTAAEQAEQTFYTVVNYGTNVLLIISVASAWFTIVTFTKFQQIITYPIKLILFLCVTIVFGHGVFPISTLDVVVCSYACAPVGAMVHYFFLANFCWCFCIAFNFYQMIVKRNPDTEKYQKYYHLVGWGFPCIFVIIVAAGDQDGGHYGMTLPGVGGTCYMDNSYYVFFTFFLPGLLIVSANAVLFFFVATEIHGTLTRAPGDKQDKNVAKEFRVLMSIFVTVGLSWNFGFLNSILQDVDGVNYVLTVLFSIFTPLQGVFIFMAYCLNVKVKNTWMNYFGQCFPCCLVDTGTGGTNSGTGSTRGGSTGSGYSASNTRSIASRKY